MLYFIGGMSQVGKSKIAEKIREQNDHIFIIHTDGCRVELPGRNRDECGWTLRVIPFINTKKDQLDILIEGVAVTPERVKELESNNILRAVFIGYGNIEYWNAMWRYALAHKDEYLYQEEMSRMAVGEPSQGADPEGEVKKSEEIREKAEAMGYKYFGMTEPPSFEERIRPITKYLLKG